MKKEKVSNKKPFFKYLWENAKSHREMTLILSVFFINTVCAILDKSLLHRSDEALGALVFIIINFLFPVLIYFLLSSKDISPKSLAKELNVTKISHRLISLPVTATLCLIFGTILLNMLFFGIYDITDGFTLYGYLTANGSNSMSSVLYMTFTFALIPAILEEVVFRKLLTRTFAQNGVLATVLISGFFYSLTAFSLRLIPSFFFAGIIYSLLFILTGSLATPIIAHVLFNLYGLFLQTNIANYFVSSQDAYALVITVIIAFLVSTILFVGIISKLLIAMAKAKKTPTPLPENGSDVKNAFKIFWQTLKTPLSLACIIVYAVFVVVFAFFL